MDHYQQDADYTPPNPVFKLPHPTHPPSSPLRPVIVDSTPKMRMVRNAPLSGNMKPRPLGIGPYVYKVSPKVVYN